MPSTYLLEIKGSTKCHTIKYRNRMGSIISSCERSDVCISTTFKHEDWHTIPYHGTCGQCWSNIYGSKCQYYSPTKHVDIRYKFVNEHVEDGIVKIILLNPRRMMQTYSPRIWVESSMLHILLKRNDKDLLGQWLYLHLGENPTYQMKEHWDAIQNHMRKIGRVLESGTEEVFFYIVLWCSVWLKGAWLKLCMTEIVHDWNQFAWHTGETEGI